MSYVWILRIQILGEIFHEKKSYVDMRKKTSIGKINIRFSPTLSSSRIREMLTTRGTDKRIDETVETHARFGVTLVESLRSLATK